MSDVLVSSRCTGVDLTVAQVRRFPSEAGDEDTVAAEW